MERMSNELPFEEALAKLEEIVQKMEDPSVSLEESMKLYKEGLELSNYCTKTLDKATLAIEQIHQKAQGMTDPSESA
jgi:exodeoxyribonuclease VII, small subunit